MVAGQLRMRTQFRIIPGEKIIVEGNGA
jgi:hypothetical protein